MGQQARFTGELIEGHKGVTVVLVPFDPEEQSAVTTQPKVAREDAVDGW